MRQLLLIVSVHLFLFLVLFAYHAQAEEDQWYVEEFDTFVVTAKNGEVTHGDKLRFFMNKGDCERMGILFSFTTLKNNKNIQNLQDKTLPIKIMHWISFLFSRLRFLSLSSLFRRPFDRKRSGTITNYKLLTHKTPTNNRSSNIWK